MKMRGIDPAVNIKASAKALLPCYHGCAKTMCKLGITMSYGRQIVPVYDERCFEQTAEILFLY